MLDSSLPLDIWTAIAGFLEVADLSSLLRTNKKILSTLDRDVIYEQFAAFPATTRNGTSSMENWSSGNERMVTVSCHH
jgi:hypothetical protein